MKSFRHIIIVVLGLAGHYAAHAELKLPAIFNDNMVLQQAMPVSVWGWSDPAAAVTVKFSGQTRTTRADAQGRWQVKLNPLKASATPQTMIVESGGTRTLTNVLVGEVWLASGQSNMEKPLGLRGGQKPVFNYEQELAAANHPQIRLFSVLPKTAAAPLADVEKYQGWDACNSNSLNAMSFSAAAYFFGREIRTNLNVPVGLIESSWGGTRIEPWTPPAGFESVPSLASLATSHIPTGKNVNTIPTSLFNAMIAPITGYSMRGVLWYQGESNLMGGEDNYDYRNYDEKMVALVNGWRALWHEGDFPFYFVQIAPFNYYRDRDPFVPSPESLPEFWTLQSRAQQLIKNSGMAVTTDLVDDPNKIHPRDKQDVGHRLALLARAKTYGENVVCSGPVFAHARFKPGKVVLSFNQVDGGLKSRDGQPLNWFTIASADGKFAPATAKIVGDTVEVSAPEVKEPKAVRFAWNQAAEPNFCNQAGLPAEPFRTDGSAAMTRTDRTK